MDLIVNSHNHVLLTIVERSTNMLFMTKLAMGRSPSRWPKPSDVCCCPTRNTSRPQTLTTVLNLPHTSSLQSIWERSFISQILMPRGRKERLKIANKLIRQYIPKQANFDDFTDKKMASIQKKINSSPRQKLRFETPKAEFFKRIA